MKRISILFACLCCMQAAYAQKPDAEIRKSVEKALEATKDPKKGAKPATWMALGKAYLTAYANPSASLAKGLDKATFEMVFTEKPISIENVTLQDEVFEKRTFSHVNAYFNGAGQLAVIETTQPSMEGDLLAESAKAYVKAFELGGKEKDVDARLQEIASKYYDDAVTAYSIGDMAKASALFQGAADVSTTAPCSVRSDDAVYNCAFTALMGKDYARARAYYDKCLENKYTSEGTVYAAVSECAMALRDTASAKSYLLDGLTAYPDNASILTSLINLYLATNEDPVKIVSLLDEAKKKMPDNPSLYYVEGNIYAGIKRYDDALAAYAKAFEVTPDYDMAYYGMGNVSLKKGEDLVEQMNALDVREYRKYDALQDELNKTYMAALEPFEKCYDVSKNADVKAAAADFLKRLNFQLRNKGAKYQKDYEKWSAIVEGNGNAQ